LEGVVGEWSLGAYQRDGITTSWIKIRNLAYSQAERRRELFERHGDQRQVHRRSRRAVWGAFNRSA